MIEFFKLANQNPWFVFFTFWVFAWMVVQPFRYAYLAYNRMLRSRNIKIHGWPTNEYMDADGDLVYPDKDDDE